MQINDLVFEAHEAAKEAGWWDVGQKKTDIEAAMLAVTELAEFVEELRIPAKERDWSERRGRYVNPEGKPLGPLTEIADAVIRLADLCGAKGWDLEGAILEKMAYNKTRGYRHGGKAA